MKGQLYHYYDGRVVFWPNLHIHCMKEKEPRPDNDETANDDDNDEDDDDDEKARRIFKMTALTEMLRGCSQLGVPLTPMKPNKFLKPKETQFAQWPIVKEVSEYAIKKASTKPNPNKRQQQQQQQQQQQFASSIKIDKSLLKPIDVGPRLAEMDEGLDPMRLHACLVSNVNQLQRQVENLGNVVDLKGKNPADIHEHKLEQILRLYTSFGRVANCGKNNNKNNNNNNNNVKESCIEEPFVLFGPNTNKNALQKAEGRKGPLEKTSASVERASLSRDSRPPPTMTAEGASHFIVKAVEPLTGISCTRSYFLRATWKTVAEETDADDDADEEKTGTDASVLAEVYSQIVETTLKAIQIYVETRSPKTTKEFVDESLTKYFDNEREQKQRITRHGGWEFRLEGFRGDGDRVPLLKGEEGEEGEGEEEEEVEEEEEGETTSSRRCFKRATIVVYDAELKRGKKKRESSSTTALGSVAFAETFVESRVKTKDCLLLLRGGITTGTNRAVLCLTEGIRRCCTWNLPLRPWPPISAESGNVLLNNNNTNNNILLSAESFQIRVRGGFNASPVGCHVTITETYLEIATRRLGSIRVFNDQIEETIFDDDAKNSASGSGASTPPGISMLVAKLRFGSCVRLPPSLKCDGRQIQLFVYAESKGLMQLRTKVLPYWESLEKPPFVLTKEPDAADVGDRRWIARRLATLGVVGVNGLTSLGSMGLKRLGTNSMSSSERCFLDANFKSVLDFMEHFLFDFALGDKPLPAEETDWLVNAEDKGQGQGQGSSTATIGANGRLNVTLINGIPGSFKESLGSCLTSLSKDGIRWLFLRHPSDVTVFDEDAFDDILESLVDAFVSHERKRRKEQQNPQKKKASRPMRAVVVVPGFTSTARVLASITRHPKPEARRRLRVGTVVACVNPENVFVDGYQVMPFVADHCSRGFVNHVVITGSENCSPDAASTSPEDEERLRATLALLERINPRANVMHAPRGQFLHANDLDVILRDNDDDDGGAFEGRAMAKMRHLLFPGWWDRTEKKKKKVMESERWSAGGNDDDDDAAARRREKAAAAMGAEIWPHSVTSMAFRFSHCLDKKKLARELKLYKSGGRGGVSGGGGDGGGGNGVIFVVTGELRFDDGGQMMRLNYSAVADKLTCYVMEEDKEENPMKKDKKERAGRESRAEGRESKAEEGRESKAEGRECTTEGRESTTNEGRESRATKTDGEDATEEPDDDDASTPKNNSLTFSGFDLSEDEIRALLLRSTKSDAYRRKSRRREEEITVRELAEIQRKNATRPMPDGWFFNGHAYVSLDGQRSQNHPRFAEFLAEYLRRTNEEVDEYNKSFDALLEEFELAEMTRA